MLGKIHFIVPKFWEKSRMRSAAQPYCNTVEYGCVSLRMRFFSQNFGTIKRILPGSSSPSHREDPGIEVGPYFGGASCLINQNIHTLCVNLPNQEIFFSNIGIAKMTRDRVPIFFDNSGKARGFVCSRIFDLIIVLYMIVSYRAHSTVTFDWT